MFAIGKPKLPITPEQRDWIDSSFVRLAALLGVQRLFEATVVLPTLDHFPDPYDRSEAALGRIFLRIAAAMQVKIRVTVAVEGGDKPACVADTLSRWYY